MAKVKALHTFAHSTAVSGLRLKGETFECSADDVETLNAIHDFPLVEIIEDEQTDTGADSPENDEQKPKKKGSKKPKVSASDSDSGEGSAD